MPNIVIWADNDIEVGKRDKPSWDQAKLKLLEEQNEGS